MPVASPTDGARIGELWRYPVKAMRGERLQEAEFTAGGVRGDRVQRVEAGGRLVTARTRRDLLGVAATIGADGEPLLDGERWEGAAGRTTLERAAPGAELVSTAAGERFDELPVLLLGRATAAELGADPRRLRPNVLIDGLAPREEEGWVGERIALGSAVLSVEYRCERCVVTTIDPDDLSVDASVLKRINADFNGRMGVVCEVVEPGSTRVGDELRVLGRE